MIRILIVDDQKTIRESIKAMLAEIEDFQVVGTAVDGYDAIAKAKDCLPNIILMDIEMPNLDGLEATKIISQQYPEQKILILTSHDDDDLVAKSFDARAEGYLLKNMSEQEIVRAIYFVSKGYTSIKPTVSITASNLADNSLPIGSSSNLNSSQIDITKEDRQLDSLREATPQEFLPPIQKWLVVSGLACVGIFAAAIALSTKLEYKVTVKAPARIRPIGELRIVQAAIEGKIVNISVAENQQVRAQALIAQIDDTRLQSQKQELLANIRQTKQQLSQLNDQSASLQRQIEAEQDLQQRNIASAQVQLRHQQRLYQEQLITTRARVSEAEAAVELAQDELNRYLSLAETGAISQLQLKEKESVLKSSLARLEQVKASLNPSEGEVLVAQEQIAQEKARGQTTLSSLNREQKQLEERQSEIENQINNYQQALERTATELAQTEIRAPVSGMIQELNLRNEGQIVQSGVEIATIAPDNFALQIKAAVAARNIGKIEMGQTAQMRVSACPYSDFGTLPGKVIGISPDTKNSPTENSDSSVANSYEIFIQPETTKLNSGDRSCLIRAGMEGNADIISKKETVLEFILRKVKLKT